MHGLALRAVQLFVKDFHSPEIWEEVTRVAELEYSDFEPMALYSDDVADATLQGVCKVLNRPQGEILEDLGTYLVSSPAMEPLRRLLRFSGATFEEFLYSLDDLPDRVRLAVPEFILPKIDLREHTPGAFSLSCASHPQGLGHVLAGMLRALADDYGALVVVDHGGVLSGVETVYITLLESTYAEGRSFELGGTNL